MRIEVDARLLRGGGIGRYLREITSRWLAEPVVDAIGFVGSPVELEPWLSEVDSRGVSSVRRLDVGPYSIRAQTAWLPHRRATEGGTWDVTFFPHYDVPLVGCPYPAVVTLHDVIHYQAPEGFPLWKRRAGALLLRRAVGRASRIVAISQTTADAVTRLLPDAAGKISVIHNGVSSRFLPPFPEDPPTLAARWSCLTPFLLTVAPDKAHKNLDLALETLAEVASSWPEVKLVLVGVGASLPPRIAEVATRLGVLPRLVALPSVGDAELRWLYRRCTALLWPSRVEGFGLPPLEALGCGAAVLAADVPASRECLGGMAKLLPLDDPGAWGTEVLSALRSGAGQAPDAPLAGLARYSWDAAAKATLDVLSEAMEDR